MIALLLGLLIQFNERPHPSGKTFCQRHLIDWDRSDPQTREHLESEEKKKQQGEEDDTTKDDN